MATQTDIPSGITDDYKAYLFQFLDAQLNSTILYALLHGIYTGILVVTLWNIFINKCWPIRRALVVVIILLHALTSINFAAKWSYIRSSFIENGSFWIVLLRLTSMAQAASLKQGIAASMSTILTDLYMIWCCWMVWGRRWIVVLLPIISLISATVSKIIQVYHDYFDTPKGVFPALYISFTLATTLWCTLLIVYRILTIAGVRHAVEGRPRLYRRFIEVLVESSALYTISLIPFLAFTIRNNFGLYYFDAIAAITKGIAPTLLVGRITAGHRGRPDDSWQGSVIASASIRSQEQEHSQTSSQEDRLTGLVPGGDLEVGVRESSPIFFPGPSAQSQGVMTLPKFEHFPLYHLGDTEGSIRSVA
ncbi:uncharacterized protein ARMOST_01582 [Armillaria ostoyae]|uniref:Uncharacterized protein n=1 Tax=Armillaria ostoyae TaxID=47428 RepID=A0A284QPC9_ARMOS|nr:uncharacterized protein ARMOST_01582 [Armillaria ostoyae]